MRWIIEKNLFEYQDLLLAEIKAQGHEVLLVDFDPNPEEAIDKLIKKHGPTVFDSSIIHGSTRLGQTHLKPYIYGSSEQFLFSKYSRRFFDYMCNHKYVMCQWWQFPTMKSELFRDREKVHIRPDSPWKVFSGGVVEFSKVDAWFNRENNCREIPPETLCIISPILPMPSEWRVLIVHGHAVTCSRYAIDGWGDTNPMTKEEIKESELVLEWAEFVAQEINYMPNMVMDIVPRDHGYNIVEIGCINTCDWYNCDLKKAVTELSRPLLNDNA